MLATMFVYGGINALRNPDAMAKRAQPVTDKIAGLVERVAPDLPVLSDGKTMVRANAAIHIGAGLALATGRSQRLAALALAATLVPTTFGGHAFWAESEPAARKAQSVHFAKNISMLGGLLFAAVDTGGKPGLAWRARRAARDVRREAKHLRREAKLAAR